MNRQDIQALVIDTISTVLKRPLADVPDAARNNVPEWDSLKHVEIMFVLEDELGMEFSEAEWGTLDSLAKIVDCNAARNAA